MATNQPRPDELPIADSPIEENITEIVSALKRLPAADIERVKASVLKLGEASSNRMECCPACGAKRIVRNGHKHGKQAYLCRDCGKSFVSTTSTIMFKSHQPTSSWLTVLSDTLDGCPIAQTAVKIGVWVPTAFYMRHKVLLAMQALLESTAMPDSVALAPSAVFLEQDPSDPSVEEESNCSPVFEHANDVFELDETYTPDSYKGDRAIATVTDRPVRKRGGTAQKPGLSNEQICICTSVGRNGVTYARSVNRAKPTNAELQEALAEHLPPDSLVLTDGASGYDALCSRRHCTQKNVKLVPQEETRLFNLNTVNSFHNVIKDRLRRYRGVATKYINRYNALFCTVYRRRWLTFDDLCRQLLTVNRTSYVRTYADVRGMDLLAI